jgi:DNA-3-methyladenine glycosylase II
MTPSYWPRATAHLTANDGVMARLIAEYPSQRLERRGDAFETLARAIVGQQISVKAAQAVWYRVEQALGGITARTVVAGSDDDLLGCGLSRQKLRYLKDLASRLMSGEIDPARLADKSDDEVAAELMEVKGIGRWTADMYLMFDLLRPDVLPLADIGLQRAMGRHYGDGGKLDTGEMTSIAVCWRPWRSVATWYLWRSLDPIPVAY